MAGLNLIAKTKLGNMVNIQYAARQNDFDTYLPTVEKIISSIKINDTLPWTN
jgi:hypothetical protein